MCMLRARLYEENVDAHNVCLHPSKEYAGLDFRQRMCKTTAVSRRGRSSRV
jgi:hypothetical protein